LIHFYKSVKMVKPNGKININIKFQDNKLDIKIISCQGLKDTDFLGKSDPYVKLFVLPGRHTVLKTKTMKGNLNPVFNSTFSFTLSREQAAKKTAVFQVFDDDMIGKDDNLGEARIFLNSVNLISGADNDYTLELQPFNTSPPVVTAQPSTNISSANLVLENNRPKISTGSGIYSSTSQRQSMSSQYASQTANTYTSSTGSYNIRDLNSRLDEIIRKNGSFHNISDDLIIRLVSKQIQESMPEDDINAQLNNAFAYTSDEIRQLAELRAQNERLVVEVDYLNKRIHSTETFIQKIQIEEANYDKMIMSCQREISTYQSEIDRIPKQNYGHGWHESYEVKLEEYCHRYTEYFMGFYEKEIEEAKIKIVNQYAERKVKKFLDRSIQSPTIIWGIRRDYGEDVKIRLDNMNMEVQPFRGLLNDIVVRYNDFIRPLANCDEQEREFRSLYDEMSLREKELHTMRMERASLRFERDRNMFNFLSEYAAKEAALNFLKQEWDLIVHRVWDSVVHGIEQSEVNRYCHTVESADNAAASTISHYQSTTNSNITGVRLMPETNSSDGTVTGWRPEAIYA